MGASSPLGTESGLGFSDLICNGVKGVGTEIFSSSKCFSQSWTTRASTLSVSPQVPSIKGSSSWCDKDLLETTNPQRGEQCALPAVNLGASGTAGGFAGEARPRVQNVWFGLDVLQEKKPLRLPDRAEAPGWYVLGCIPKLRRKPPLMQVGQGMYM